MPIATKHLSPQSRAWVAQVAADYALEPHHERLVLLAAEALDRAEQARQRIEADGAYVLDRWGQLKAHPAVAVERDSRTAYARLLRDLELDNVVAPVASIAAAHARRKAG
jgi:hypothetical protein